jgi:predicted lipid-binding transport protein (Tim44 family)
MPGWEELMTFRFRPLFAVLAILGALAFVVADADARGGKGGSIGSRGSRTYSAPAPTATAPNAARPVERSMTQPGATATAGRTSAAQPGGLFNRPGLMGGLIAGFLGAGLLGLLFGNGLFGGLGGLASVFGLLLQIGLVVIVGRLLWNLWQRRQQPAQAFAGGPASPRSAQPESFLNSARSSLGGMGGGAAPSSPAVEITPQDFDTFERLLGEIQTAFGKADLNALRARLTPEMLSYFSEQLAEDTSRGVVNQISGVKLLQGDLAESWREGNTEYATVAMRYELIDAYIDRASGRVVEGDLEHPQEVTEVWTFMRAHGGDWLLSAIQQT